MSFITFAWHLLIALFFIIVFYMVVTYTSLKSEIEDIEALKRKLDSQLEQDYRLYINNQYNEAVIRFNIRKKSIFSRALLKILKKLDHQIPR